MRKALLFLTAWLLGGALLVPAYGIEPDPMPLKRIAKQMKVPWGVGFLPDGSALVTERSTGRIYLVKGSALRQWVGTITQVRASSEGGLLGLAVSPTFAQDRRIYVYVGTATDNRVLRIKFRTNNTLGRRVVILSGIPGAPTHDGGRLAFGPDGYLYVATGDARQKPNPSQDLTSLGGKILRITSTGEPAPGNPFGTRVYSYGHRNVQGLAWDSAGNLWASELGENDVDELNMITAGGNYGWPVCEGNHIFLGTDPCPSQYVAPKLTFATSEASPSGLAYAGGSLWMATLRGQRLYRISLNGQEATESGQFFEGVWGRLRTVQTTPSGKLWLTTSNRDGRGSPVRLDDRILLIQP
jgi:glucose/arabinose dehydrogenase